MEWSPSPNFDDRQGTAISFIILHYTAMEDDQKAIDWLCNPASEVSAHYMVCKTGQIHCMVEPEFRAWHAGKSSFMGLSSLNAHSVGIEIGNIGGDMAPDYPEVQINSVIELCQVLVKRFNIPAYNIIAHSDVAPERKQDPGRHFPWAKLAQHGLGLWLKPPSSSAGIRLFEEGKASMKVKECQQLLLQLGYCIKLSGHFDAQTATILRAFQRHFIPTQTDGNMSDEAFSHLKELCKRLAQLKKSSKA